MDIVFVSVIILLTASICFTIGSYMTFRVMINRDIVDGRRQQVDSGKLASWIPKKKRKLRVIRPQTPAQEYATIEERQEQARAKGRTTR